MDGTVLWGGGEEVSIVSVVYPPGTVSISSLFCLLVLLLNILILI